MQEAFNPPFRPPTVPAARYEKTLKERLAAGETIKHFDGRFQVATMSKLGDLILMTGFTGRHSLDFANSDTKRIEAHWHFFCQYADNQKRRVARAMGGYRR